MTWPMVKLENLVSITSGFAFKSNLFSESDGVPLIRIRDVVRGETETFYTGEYSNEFIINNGDILIGMDGDFNRARWKGGRALLNQRVCRIKADESNLCDSYLYHFLPKALDSINEKTHAVTVKHLSVKGIRDIKIPLPPLTEQKRIAAILDKADAIRQKRQQAIALADDFLRSVFLDMFGDPVTNPKGWEVIKLGSCCRFQGGFAFKSEDYCDSGIPLVKITNVHFENIDWSDVSYVPADFLDTKAEFALKDEDLVMAMTRPIIKSLNAVKVIEVKEMDLPCLLNQRVGRFIDYENSFKKHFLKYLLYSDFFMNEVEKLCSVALQPNISAKQIEAITCYIPPIELQDEFSQIAKQIEQTIPHMSSFNDLDLFGSLNSKAFSGQL
ncbi:restriction endonuclease subunit S [Aeromonas veronii]|uniref:restriction endonuclease subunit S n=1 Tax=Aeromonas veronii TaxID=654 RepID=UPI003D1BC2DA